MTAQCIVDAFEMVQIHQDHRDLGAFVVGALQQLTEPVHEETAIGQSGERVVVGQIVEALRLGDVLQGK
nr:hypothetical protein [Thiocystis minor]